jgi:Short C-terminal domain
MRRRVGRPGLVGTMARTAVVAGTATAVVGGMNRSQQAKSDAAYEQQAANQAAFDSQAQMADMQAQMNAMQSQQPAPAAASAPAGNDTMAKIQQLADLHASGVLTDEEFAAAKAKLLA